MGCRVANIKIYNSRNLIGRLDVDLMNDGMASTTVEI